MTGATVHSGAIVSHQGTSPGVDFTYTVEVNGPDGPERYSGLRPRSSRPADYDVVAAPPGTPCDLIEVGDGQWWLIVQEFPATEECEA